MLTLEGIDRRNAERDCGLMLSWRGLSFLGFSHQASSPELLLANRLRGAATGENLQRMLSETKTGVNRLKKILKVIRLCQIDIIIAFNTFP
jgi:hypothetical protein